MDPLDRAVALLAEGLGGREPLQASRGRPRGSFLLPLFCFVFSFFFLCLFPPGHLPPFARVSRGVATASTTTTAAAAAGSGAFDLGHHLLLLHPPVLKPDSDLSLGKVSGGGNLPPLVLGDELAIGIFLLQLFQLPFAVRYSLLAAASEGAALGGRLTYSVWPEGRKRDGG